MLKKTQLVLRIKNINKDKERLKRLMNYNDLAQQYLSQADDVYSRRSELKSKIKGSKHHSTIKDLRTRIVVLEEIYIECRVTAYHILKCYGGSI